MRVLDETDGFNPDIGYSMDQDSINRLWISSNRGAFCFDGVDFQVYDEEVGLRDTEILDVISGSGGMILLCPILNNMHVVKNDVLDRRLSKDLSALDHKMANITINDPLTNEIWLADVLNRDFVYKLGPKGVQKVEIPICEPFQLLAAKGGHLCLKQNGLLFQYNTLEDSIFSMDVAPGFERLAFETGFFIGKYLIAFDPQSTSSFFLCEYDQHEAKLKPYRQLKLTESVEGIIVDNLDRLWVTSFDSSLAYYGYLDDYQPGQKALRLFENLNVNYIYSDDFGNLWVTTESSRLFFISRAHWESYLKIQELSLPDDNIAMAVEKNENGKIFFGFEQSNALGVLDSNGFRYLHDSGPDGFKGLYSLGDYLFSYGSGKVFIYENASLQEPVVVDLPGRSIKSICVDPKSESRLLVGTHGDTQRLTIDLETGKIEKGEYLFHQRSTALLHLNDSLLLIGTPNGFYVFRKHNDGIEELGHQLKDLNINQLLRVDENNVLVSTTMGVFNYQLDIEELTPLNLPVKQVNKIRQGAQNAFWLCTNEGLIKVIYSECLADLSFETFGFSHGLPSLKVYDVTFIEDQLLICTSKGFSMIDPSIQVPDHSGHSELYIKSVSIHDSTIFLPTGLQMPHYNNDLTISVRNTNFYRSSVVGFFKDVFVYKLHGFHEQWYQSASPELDFQKVTPGSYTLQVYLQDRNGQRLSKTLSFPVVIEAALWQTSWFRALLALVSLGMIIWVVYRMAGRRKKKLLRQVELRKRLAELELKAIKAQINPHFIYNCLNSIRCFIEVGHLDKTAGYMELFAILLRQTMALSRQTFISVKDEVEYLNNYLTMEKLRFKDKLDYNVVVSPELHSLKIPAMMLQPFVENAIKHGISARRSGGKLEVRFEMSSVTQMRILVKDNGPGIDLSKGVEVSSLGMELAGGRADAYNELFGSDISINIARGPTDGGFETGTAIELLIPLENEILSPSY